MFFPVKNMPPRPPSWFLEGSLAVGASASGALRGADELPTFLQAYVLFFRMETASMVVTTHFYPLK